MLGGLSYLAVRDAIFSHPTMAEGLGPLLANVSAQEAKPKSVARA
jgi:hypothetical protein